MEKSMSVAGANFAPAISFYRLVEKLAMKR